MVIKRGDMFYADLSPVVGSEQGGIRPVLVIQNNTGNKYSPTVIVSANLENTSRRFAASSVDNAKPIADVDV